MGLGLQKQPLPRNPGTSGPEVVAETTNTEAGRIMRTVDS